MAKMLAETRQGEAKGPACATNWLRKRASARFEIITRVRSIAIVAVLTVVAETLFAQNSVSVRIAQDSVPKVELRVLPTQLEKGLTKSFTFVFVNRSGHQLRMPR